MKAATFPIGCKVNQYETEAIAEKLEALGFERVDFREKADVYVINSCTATRKARATSALALPDTTISSLCFRLALIAELSGFGSPGNPALFKIPCGPIGAIPAPMPRITVFSLAISPHNTSPPIAIGF